MTKFCKADTTGAPARRISYNSRLRPAARFAGARVEEPGMGRWVVTAALLLLGVAAPSAQAQFDVADGWRVVAQRAYERDNGRRGERRDERREERRRADRNQRESLTPDEHRELNRDLQRANREFYRKGKDRR
jgi:hypothetical protein